MKAKHLAIMVLSFSVILLFSSCKSDIVTNSNPQNDQIKNEVFAKYTLLSKAPFYKPSTMLTEYNSSLYRFGTLDPVQVYNLNSQSWTNLPLPDSSDARWNGAALNIDGTIYIVGVSQARTDTLSFDILKYDLALNKYEHTGVNLPYGFSHPAYGKYNKKIYFISAATIGLFEYNVSLNKLIRVAASPFPGRGNYVNDLFSSGVYGDYLYVFLSNSTNEFYRFNLLSNTWEKLSVPVRIEKKRLYGASMGSQMIFLCDSLSTYKYDYNNSEWTVDTSPVPLVNQSLNDLSFCSRDTCLYVTEAFTNTLWKISLK